MAQHTWRFADPPPVLPLPVPDAAQHAVIAWSTGPALVVGAPGTGKTLTLVAAALARIAEGAAPSSMLLLTFSRDAAAAMRQQLAEQIGTGEPPRVSTFHAFALDLVGRLEVDGPPLRLLSGAEQERSVRDVIDGTLEDAALRGRWPAELHDALGTRGFAREVRAAFAAARALGLAGDEVAAIGRRAGNAAWTAVGPVLDEYLETQAQQQALDYAELMFRAVQAVHDERNAPLFRDLLHVYVDEYQEVDRMQVALLKGLSRGLASLVVAADPDQSVFGFRGADLRSIRDFPDDFAAMAARCALAAPGFLTLDVTHRLAPAVRNFTAGIFGSLAPYGLPASLGLQHRMPRCADAVGGARAFLYDDPLAEAAAVAVQVRALAGDEQCEWSDIAVIARSAASLGPIERALRRSGIPCDVDLRSESLAEEPAVRALLGALDVVAARELAPTPGQAHALLLSPLCGLDPTELRALARALRTDRAVASDAALAAALASPTPHFEDLEGLPGALRFEALRMLLQRVHARVAAGASPHEALWLLWSATPWPRLLQRQALEAGSALAHRDLDAVCELFDIADRSVQRRQGHAGVSAFLYELRAQDVPAETLAGRGYRGDAVQLLTAHAAKGGEWKHVFVVAVSEGIWPNLRGRASVLDVDRLSAQGIVDARGRAALFEEERRLFYLACTRSRGSLTVSGWVDDGDEGQGSRLLAHPDLKPVRVTGRPQHSDSAASLVAQLRSIVTAADADPALRAAAVARLRTLHRMRDGEGVPLFPEADPSRWWGVRPRTVSPEPVDPVAAPLYVRGSSLEMLSACGLAWFLQQRAHAEGPRGSAVVFGSAIHALIDGVTKGEVEANESAMATLLRGVWNDAGYDSTWQSQRDFEQALAGIARFLRWRTQRTAAHVISEVAFNGVIDVRTPTGRIEHLRMRGTMDRLEIADDGTAVVFDFKTSRTAVGQDEAREHAQLRYYQYAIDRGLLDAAVPDAPVPLTANGAELVYLRLDAPRTSTAEPKTLGQPALGGAAEEWAVDVLGAGLDVVRTEAFEAVTGKHCRVCSMQVVCPVQPEGRVETA